LDLGAILPADHMQAIKDAGKLVFHFNGDVGGIKESMPQLLVAKGMEADIDEGAAPADNPAFLYILGDCVYFNGAIGQYYSQFYHPYEYYHLPIFAVPGNHDGENLPGGTTLDGFMENFCAATPVQTAESGDSGRTAMTQPNVYWTLLTPLVNIVGLYSNVPDGGDVRPPQTDWLADQLTTLPRDKPLFVTLHHPIYSADDFHSGSTQMKQILEEAIKKANRRPEMVFAGHVHDYQRLAKIADGAQVPYIVAGAGGYHNLHGIKKVDGEAMITPVLFQDNDGDQVTLERYSDDHHGFLRLEVTGDLITGRYYTVPRPQDPYSKPSQLFDYFEFDWRNRRYVPNRL
jgi:hypothetical protein